MASIGELCLVDFGEPHLGEPAAQRPALVLGPPNALGPGLPFVVLAPLTTKHRGLDLHVEVEPSKTSGLDEVSYVQCEQFRSVNKRRLLHRLGEVDILVRLEVAEVIRSLLSLERE